MVRNRSPHPPSPGGFPIQNACVESFNGTFHNACLKQHGFTGRTADGSRIEA